MTIALELARTRPVYEDVTTEFFEHLAGIGASHQISWPALVANLFQRSRDTGCPYCIQGMSEYGDVMNKGA